MSAVNGTAATPLRSDGRHAIDSAIAPTWTGAHTFTQPVRASAFLPDTTGPAIQTGIVGSSDGNHVTVYTNSVARGTVNSAGHHKFEVADNTHTLWSLGGSGISAADFDTAGAVGLTTRWIRNTVLRGEIGSGDGVIVSGSSSDFGISAVNDLVLASNNGTERLRISASGVVTLSSPAAAPQLYFAETGGSANEGRWLFYADAGVFRWMTENDAGSVNRGIMQTNRSGAAVTAMTFGNTTDNPTYEFLGTGRVTFGGVARLKGYTVATLPAGTVGDSAYVTDALAPVFLGAAAGGGAITCTVFYNGANWVVQ